MPARVPELNTQGYDATNSIVKGLQAKETKLDIETKNMNNALLREQMSPEAVARRNIILKNAEKASKLELETRTYDHARKGLLWTMDQVNNGEVAAYPAFRKHMIEDLGLPPHALPKFNNFFKNETDINNPTGQVKVFDEELFNKWADNTLKITDEAYVYGKEKAKDKIEQKTIYNKDGRTMSVGVTVGENVDPEIEFGSGWSFVDRYGDKGKTEKTNSLTPGQQATGVRHDENTLIKLEQKLTKPGKEGQVSPDLVDKNSSTIQMYNKKAKNLGMPQYVWKENAFEQEVIPEDKDTGLLGLPGKIATGVKEFFAGKDVETESVGGWVKAGAEETKPESASPESASPAKNAIGDTPEAEVEKLPSGGIFYKGGKKYRKS